MSFATDLGFDVIVSQFNLPLSLTNRQLMQLSIMQLASFKPCHMLSTRKKNRIYKSVCITYADYVALPAFARRTPR